MAIPYTGVFPNHRLSPSGPVLSGEGGPIIQIGFDQVVADSPADLYSIPAAPPITIPRNITAPIPPVHDILSVLLTNVGSANLIAVWSPIAARSTDDCTLVWQLAYDDGVSGIFTNIDFAQQAMNLVSPGAPAGTVDGMAIATLFPNPFGVRSDVRIVLLVIADTSSSAIISTINQVAILAAEIAKT